MKTPRQVIIRHNKNALAKNEGKIVAATIRETGFEVEKEIFRGEYYHKGKTLTGSVLLKGRYKDKPAVLKIQGLKLDASETKIMRIFEKQNKSKIIHTPKLYLTREWNARRGYGFSISEYVGTSRIFKTPFATRKQMKDFARFYQEYRTKAITKPWIKPTTNIYVTHQPNAQTLLSGVIEVAERWRKNAEKGGRLKLEDYAPYLFRFYLLAARYVPTMKIAFMHRELIAQHIFKLHDGTYTIFSNLLWGYRLEWGDLSYNIWRCILDIRSNSYSFQNLLRYVLAWLRIYKTIPVTKKDKDFDTKIKLLVLERIMGIILGDLGIDKYWGSEKGKKYFRHMLQLNQKLFDYFASELEK